MSLRRLSEFDLISFVHVVFSLQTPESTLANKKIYYLWISSNKLSYSVCSHSSPVLVRMAEMEPMVKLMNRIVIESMTTGLK